MYVAQRQEETHEVMDISCVVRSGDPPLQPGVHTFPFTFNVPSAPASIYDETEDYVATVWVVIREGLNVYATLS